MPTQTVAMQGDESLDTWFRCEILCHEERFMRFLARLWRNRDELEDIRQESYSRVYQAALKARPEAPKAFLFATARHLLVDWRRHERCVPMHAVPDSQLLDAVVDEASPELHAATADDLRQVFKVLNRLSARCREVIWMRRIQELPQREVARRLGVSEKAIEKHVANAGRRLAHLR